MFRERYNEEAFRRWLMTKIGSDAAYCYSKIVRRFFRNFDELNEENIRRFIEGVKASERTKSNYISALNAYKKFLGIEEKRKEVQDPLLDEILRLMEGRYAKHTVKMTREHCRRWLIFLRKLGKKAEEATKYDAELFLSEIGKEAKKATLIAYVVNLRRFYRMLGMIKGIQNNPFSDIKIRPEKPLPRYLEIEEIKKLKEEAKRMGEREYALVCLLYSSGIRISEACNLKWEDVDIRRRRLIIRSSKTGEGRVAFFNEETAIALTKWKLRTRWGNPSDRVFLVKSPYYLTRLIREIGNRCGIYVTPHMLRHSLGTHLVRAGVELRVVQEILGHKDIRNTQIYTKLSLSDVERRYREFWESI